MCNIIYDIIYNLCFISLKYYFIFQIIFIFALCEI